MSNSPWIKQAERALVVSSGLGTLASVTGQNAFFACAPLSVLALLELAHRHRHQDQLDQTQKTLSTHHRQLEQGVINLNRRLTALPSPESLTQFQRSVVDRNSRNFTKLHQEIQGLRTYISNPEEFTRTDDLKPIRQEISQLQEQYTTTLKSIHNLNAQVARLPTSTRLKSLEDQLPELKSKLQETQADLQGMVKEMRQQTRRWEVAKTDLKQEFSRPKDHLNQEVDDDRVSQGEFSSLINHVKRLAQRQADLERALNQIPIGSVDGFSENRRELDRLGFKVSELSQTLRDSRRSLIPLTKRLQYLETKLNQSLPLKHLESHPALDWIIDFPSGGGRHPHQVSSYQVLYQILEQTQGRILLVWPWSSHIHLDQTLLEGFSQFLQGGGHLTLGWCHQGNLEQGRLVGAIAQGWGQLADLTSTLQAPLQQLLSLRQQYRERFKFKIIGTVERYLVCHPVATDQAYAILSLQTLQTHSLAIPELDVKLRTTQPEVVQSLMEGFANPTIGPTDGLALFNRATTYHDLGDRRRAIADYSQILDHSPHQGVIWNNRGVAHLELGLMELADQDFQQAIRQDPEQFAPYCNRGWLHLHQGDYGTAMAAFSQVLQHHPQLGLAYLYRGRCQQKLGMGEAALVDYNQAIAADPQAPLPYCYRSAIYEARNNLKGAIADLEVAVTLLKSQDLGPTLVAVEQKLNSLRDNFNFPP
ncbi:MAG: tetratricopeptide repeat protein [Nodosilinea sp. LVE1205-7]